jgi:hypothetical protein
MYWFKRKYRQIKRVIDFLPIIWNGFDFDYRYSLDLFKKQLERQAKFLESDRAMTLSAKHNASRIRTAIRLMDKVYDEEYGMEYIDTIEKLYGTTHYDWIALEEKDKKGEPYYRMELRNELAVDEKHQKEIDEVRNQMSIHSNEKQKRAHKLLWNFIEHNIRHWWD